MCVMRHRESARLKPEDIVGIEAWPALRRAKKVIHNCISVAAATLFLGQTAQFLPGPRSRSTSGPGHGSRAFSRHGYIRLGAVSGRRKPLCPPQRVFIRVSVTAREWRISAGAPERSEQQRRDESWCPAGRDGRQAAPRLSGVGAVRAEQPSGGLGITAFHFQ